MPIRQATPQEAHRLLGEGYRYIDVRTEAEFAGAHPAGALNIPVVIQDPATRRMGVNPDFVRVVEAHFSKDVRLVVGCQAGGRSHHAAELLAQAGYTQVVDMQAGFGGMRDQTGRTLVPGWVECALPVCNECSPGDSYAALRAAAVR